MPGTQVSLEFAGRYLNRQEHKLFAEIVDTANRESVVNTEKGKPYLETLLQTYPGFRQPDLASNVYKESLKGYNAYKYPTAIRPGDLCFSLYYGVEIPNAAALKKIGKELFGGSRQQISLERLAAMVQKAWSMIPHVENKCNNYLPPPGHSTPFFDTMNSKYAGKSVRLEDIVSGKLPGVCFEKSLLLAALLSMDDGIKKAGIGVYLSHGTHIEEGWVPGSHAWVRIEVPKSFDKKILAFKTYILDPTFNRIFVLDVNGFVAHPRHKYEENYYENIYTGFNFKSYSAYRKAEQTFMERLGTSGIVARIKKYLRY